MLMKIVLCLATFAGIAFAQRGSYAGNSAKGYPELANRFRETDDGASSTAGGVPVVNRINVDSTGSSTQVPSDFNKELENRINQWPREHRPFSVLNADHIQQQLHPSDGQQQLNNFQTRFAGDFAGGAQIVQPLEAPRPFFLGP